MARSMVEWNEVTGRYRLHDLARVFADSRLSDEERLGGQRRHAGHFVAVLAAARRLQDREAEGNHLGNLGLAYAHLGEPRRAIEYYERQLLSLLDQGNGRQVDSHAKPYGPHKDVGQAPSPVKQAPQGGAHTAAGGCATSYVAPPIVQEPH